jgi:hypothetical protein
MYVLYIHIYETMKSNALAIQKGKARFQKLWPALNGTLVQVRKPCIRKNCPACARGEKHPAWMLSFSHQGRRHCLYVPLALVPTLRQAHRNGQILQKILYDMGPAIIKEFRRQRTKTTPPRLSKS